MRASRILVTAAALAAASVPLATGTAAAAPPSDCPAGALCVYVDRYYHNGPYRFFGSNTSWAAWPAIFNNDSSWFNNGTKGYGVSVFREENYLGGRMFCLARGVGFPSAILIDDNGESNRWDPSC